MEKNFLIELDIYNHIEKFNIYKIQKNEERYELRIEEKSFALSEVLINFLNSNKSYEYLLNTFGIVAYQKLYETMTKEKLQTKFDTKTEYNNYVKKIIDICRNSVAEVKSFFQDYLGKIYNYEEIENYSIASRQMRELLYIQDENSNIKLYKKFEESLFTDIKINTKVLKQKSLVKEETTKYYLRSDDILTLLYLELKYLPRYQSFFINKCEYCGDYFIPASRSDEKFCANVYEDGTTCKTLGVRSNWKNVISEDEVRKLYNNLYQKKLMYCKRNSDNQSVVNEFERWKKKAKELMKKYKKSEIDKDKVLKMLK